MSQNLSYDPAAFRQFEHDQWDSVSGSYQDAFGVITCQAIGPLLEEVGAGPGVRLLEVACGPGELTGTAAGLGAAATGLDFVASMIAEARRRHTGATFQEGDAEALPFEDGSFDAVVCSFGILHFPHPERALAEAYRVLAPGGRFAMTAWCHPQRSPLMGLIYGTFQAHAEFARPVPAGPDIFRFGDAEYSCTALAEAGFAEPAGQELPLVSRFAAPEGVLGMIKGGTARTKGVMEHITEASRHRIESTLIEGARAFQTATGVEIPIPALLAAGRKP